MPLGRLATLKPSGSVTICTPAAPGDCLQNWDSAAPILRVGQRSELNGFRCISETKGITCTVIAGAGKGKGFLITNSLVTKIGG